MDSDQRLLREGTQHHPGPTSASATTQATKPKSHTEIHPHLIQLSAPILYVYI